MPMALLSGKVVVLDDKVEKPVEPEIVAQPKRAANVKKSTVHLSWADPVKTRPRSSLRSSLAPTIGR
jgi:hypothetical protein